MIQVTPVILCGGAGTRLWPLSRGGFPKQFLSLNGNETLLKQASKRLMQLGNADIQISKPLIVTGEEHLFLAVEQLREIDIEVGIALLEPKCRNTPTALTLAAQLNGEDPVLVVTPADQVITNLVVFTQAVQEAKHEASGGRIVILGITPDEPEIGYGYIEAHGRNHQGALQMKCFVEKPVVITAQNYLNEGGYFWNVGMFVLKASVRLRALEAFRPDVFDLTNQLQEKRFVDSSMTISFIRKGKEEFANILSESIDYAVMEKYLGSQIPIAMIPLDAGQSDLGAWDAVWNVLSKDNQGNVHYGDVSTSDLENWSKTIYE